MSLRLNAADITNMGTPAAGLLPGPQDAGSAPVPPGFAALLQLGAAVGPVVGTNAQPSDPTSGAGASMLQTGRMRVRPVKEADDVPAAGPAVLPSPQLMVPIAIAPSPLETTPLPPTADAPTGPASPIAPNPGTINAPAPQSIPAPAAQADPLAASNGSNLPASPQPPVAAALPAASVLPAETALPLGDAAQPQDAPTAVSAPPSDAPAITATAIAAPAQPRGVTPLDSPGSLPVSGNADLLTPPTAPQDAAKGGAQQATHRSAATPSPQSTSGMTSTVFAGNMPSNGPAARIDGGVASPSRTAPVSPQHTEVKATAAAVTAAAQIPGEAISTSDISPVPAALQGPTSPADTSASANSPSFSSAPISGFATTQDASTGDGSSQSGSGSGGQTAGHADHKSRPGDMQPVSGDGTRVGMGGWVASAPAREVAGASHAAANVPAAASNGMAQMAVDRTASDSSARRLNNALQSEMGMGVQTDAFGRVHIQTSVTGRELSAQISLEHSHASSSGLMAQMPALEDALREKYGLAASVSVRADAGSTAGNNTAGNNTAGNGQPRQGDQPRQTPETYTALPYLQAGSQTASTPLHGRAAIVWAGSQPSGRLDITI